MISGLIVCVNYADMLKLTIENSIKILNTLTVVTTPEDKETIDLCKKYNVNVLEYGCCFCENDKKIVDDPNKLFHLSKMINQGLMYIIEHYPNDWILYVNSDILLNPSLANVNLDNFDENVLYGSWRHVIPTKAEYDEIYNNGDINFGECYARFPNIDGDGSVGFGFFQLFKKRVFYDQTYKFNGGISYDASYSDLLFVKKFSRVERIDSYTVLHLGKPGVNWFGRISERWE